MKSLSRQRAGRSYTATVSILIFGWVVAAVRAPAQPGTLDTNFSANLNNTVLAVALQSDGKVLVGGVFDLVDAASQRGIARLHTNGFRDGSFTATVSSEVDALAVDTNNRVVLGGSFSRVNSTPATNLARVLPNGTTDDSFLASANRTVEAVALQPDGKVLVGGLFFETAYAWVGMPRNRITRLNPDSTDDNSFASTNRGANSTVFSIAVQPDGKILAGGAFSMFDGQPRSRLVRLNPDTMLDTGFNASVSNGTVFAIALQANSQMLVGGSFTTVNGMTRRSLARLNPDGSLDESFDAGVESGTVYAIALDSAGRIYVAGYFTSVGGTPRNYLARLHPDGALDTGFETGRGPDFIVYGIAVQPNDDVIIGGAFTAVNFVSARHVARVRGGPSVPSPPLIVVPLTNQTVRAGFSASFVVRATGSPRLFYQWQFNGTTLPGQSSARLTITNALPEHGGTYTVIVSNELGVATSEAVLTVNASVPGFTVHPTNQIALWGQRIRFFASATGAPNPTLQWQFNAADIQGARSSTLTLSNVDYSHAGFYAALASNAVGVTTSAVAQLVVNPPVTNAGAVDLSFNPALVSSSETPAAVIQLDGKIILARSSSIGGPGAGNIRRLNADGSLDTSFNTNAFSDGSVFSMDLQADGKVVLGGWFSRVNGTNRHQLARLHSDGTLDMTFNPLLNTHIVRHAIVQPDGKVLVAGDVSSFSVGTLILGRVLPDGSHDPNFKHQFRHDPGGAAPTPVTVYGLALQSDGKILLASSLGLRRFLPHGALDMSFNAPSNLFFGLGYPFTIALQPDGRILIGTTLGNDIQPPTILRLNRDGSVDNTYNAGRINSVQAITVQPDGKAIIAGSFSNRLARLNNDGSRDLTFDPGNLEPSPNPSISRILLKPTCEIIVLGSFQEFNRYARPGIVQLHNDPPAPPVIARHPQAQNVFAGQTARFSVDVSCPPQPSFQWHKDGDPVPGATRALLSLSNTQPSDAGNYTVVVSNALGVVTSAPAALVVGLAPSNAGAVDISFASGTGPNDSVYAAIKQPDGKIIIGGLFSMVDHVPRSRVARLNADGSLDTSFDPGSGAGGVLFPAVHALALLPDGRILVGGFFSSFNGLPHQSLARLNSDGSVDTSFGTNAVQSLPTIYALAVQRDGKIIYGSDSGRRVERLNANGTRDFSFNQSGSGATFGSVRALSLDADGKIVCGGDFHSYNGTSPYLNGLVRLQTNGTRDVTFSPPQIQIPGIAYSVVSLPDGYLVGGLYGGSNGISRLQRSGQLAGAPWVTPRITSTVYAVAVDSCGHILIGGSFRDVNGTLMRGLARLTAQGGLEPTFAPVPLADGSVRALLPLDNSRFIAAGDFSEINDVRRPGIAQLVEHVEGAPLLTAQPTNQNALFGQDFTLTAVVDCPPQTSFQWQQNGVDIAGATNATLQFRNVRGAQSGEYRLIAGNEFGSVTSAVATVTLTPASTMPGRNDIDFYPEIPDLVSVWSLALQPDGKLLIGGWFTDRFSIERLNADGSLDPTFATTNTIPTIVTSLAVQSNGQIVAADFYDVLRFNSDGSLDTTFIPDVQSGASYVVTQPDGKHLVAGDLIIQGTRRRIARLLANGAVDPSFSAPVPDAIVLALALQPDGKLLIGGSFTNVGATSRPRLTRLNGSGSVDTNFASGFLRSNATIYAVAVQPDGKILAGGSFTNYGGELHYDLVRLQPDGTRDTTFNPLLHQASTVRAIVLQPDGKIILGGFSGAGELTNGVVRLHRDGSFDRSFGPGARVRRDLATGVILALALTPRGKIYAGGSFTHYDGFSRGAVARIHGDPEILAPLYTGGTFRTSIYTDAGRTYFLEGKSSLNDMNWTVLQAVTGNSSVQTLSDPSATGASRFYRVRVE